MDLIAITAAYNGLMVGREVLTTFMEGKTQVDSQGRVLDALVKLASAQDTIYEMRDELFRLQSENQDLRRMAGDYEQWTQRLSGYSLQSTSGGAIVYVSHSEPRHFVCPTCVNKREIQILQDNRTFTGKFRCTGCQNEYPINPRRDASKE